MPISHNVGPSLGGLKTRLPTSMLQPAHKKSKFGWFLVELEMLTNICAVHLNRLKISLVNEFENCLKFEINFYKDSDVITGDLVLW